MNKVVYSKEEMTDYEEQCSYHGCFKQGRDVGAGKIKNLYFVFKACDEHYDYVDKVMLEHD